MNIIFKFLVLGLTLILMGNSACTSFATGALQAYNENAAEERRQNRAISSVVNQNDLAHLETIGNCVTRVEDRPKFYQLNLKSPDIEKMTFKHLSDPTYITYEEKVLVKQLLNEIDYCYKPNTYQSSSPSVTQLYAILDEAWNNLIIEYARLYNGQITWGELNTEGSRIMNRLNAKSATWHTDVSKRIQNNYEKSVLIDEIRSARNQRQQLMNDLNSARNEIRNLNRRVRYNNINIY